MADFVPCPCGHVSFGYTLANGVLRKEVVYEKHHLYRPKAWGIQEAVLDTHHADIKLIELFDREHKLLWSVPMDTFWAKKLRVDRGYGAQWALTDDHWTQLRLDTLPKPQPDF
jgi:hypothetical protein